MAQLLIKNAEGLDRKTVDIMIEDGIITDISPRGRDRVEVDRTIEAKDHYVMPGLCNSHTHASMSILRGVGEDMELKPWLEERIWPLERKMRIEHLRAGMALACLEMIRTGTTLFNDMYFREGELAEVVSGMGLRAFLGEGFIDLSDEVRLEESKRNTIRSLEAIEELDNPLVSGGIAPHAVYTVSDEGLSWCGEEAARRGLPLHIHVSETLEEVRNCMDSRKRTPVQLLDDLNLLGPSVMAAHSVHISEDEMKILSGKRVNISHVPVSNMKLSVGGPMNLRKMLEKNMNVTIGTDGAASNNSLDLLRSMKTAALLSKQTFGVTSIAAPDILEMATRNGYAALGVNGGILEAGKVADLILLDRKHPSLVPGNDPISDVIYSASGDAVTHSIVGGKILMENGKVSGEEKIIEDAIMLARELTGGD